MALWSTDIRSGGPMSNPGRSLHEPVPQAPDREDVAGFARVFFDLLAQPLHVHVVRLGVAEVVVPPDLLDQEMPSEEPALPGDEGLQELELLGSELDQLSAH